MNGQPNEAQRGEDLETIVARFCIRNASKSEIDLAIRIFDVYMDREVSYHLKKVVVENEQENYAELIVFFEHRKGEFIVPLVEELGRDAQREAAMYPVIYGLPEILGTLLSRQKYEQNKDAAAVRAEVLETTII